ncbi:Periodic tryptophan protein 2 homolog [Caenorhabditis elegans]|uniref:Periodic tryptophan protein 2 homolog n=1 Tax=Caenorhabditis elegans TaxID=6239 RepID=PWP2_CAEEL|nr:Periodic tryptophan protein 2 homolog [Caenorhabditis elegans]P91341.2 RecName: Full=Periodic tryptophan protein 2 homolog [Caenorhabditis elegans]CCD71885.1 Periodic tryptophan protein 2 homolog [Caenorhabditis elegans]|eukprot:NP_491653.2 Periodic tryptophan protein 2 homolog [Caenorhabditis elegans]
MDTNFKLSNCIGTVYRDGQVAFSKDGYSVISPIGNKLSIFDLRNNTSKTLDIDCNYNIKRLSISPSGYHLLASDERGVVHFVHLLSEFKIYTFRSNKPIGSLQWSPDATRVAICRENDLQIHEFGKSIENKVYNPFSLSRTYKLSSDSLKTIDWSDDANLLVSGGEDRVVRVVGAKDFKNLFIHPLASHKGYIVNCQFMKNSYDMITVCKRGLANVWTCNLRPGELVEGIWKKDEEGSDDIEMLEDGEQKVEKIFFEKTKKYWLSESSGSGKSVDVTAARFHKETNILATAFNNGVIVLHEIPSFALVHNLRVSEMRIQTVAWNLTGDWLAIGCGKGSTAQLVVWEWQSESYVMKQQAHSLRITTAEYSPDGSLMATGAEDGKVKIWNSRSSFCTVTFDEHTSGVTAVKWTQSGRAILSASLDGTVRAHDLKRYRNFRTLVCPEPTQLATLAVDKAGDLVIAGAKEVFNIYIWSFETGHLLDILSGHESAISSIDIHGNHIVSGSWDRTIKMWTIVDSQAETVEVSHEALDVKFSPAGDEIAVLTSDGVITFFEAKEMINLGSIDTKLDTDPARGSRDTITRQSAAKTKTFTRIRFSPDGNLLLAGGESNNFCLYSVPERMILKKWQITANRSLDGVILDFNRRNFTEFGNMQLVDTSDEEDELEPNNKMSIKLPGTKNFDLGERRARPEVNIYEVTYCPTGRRFAICSTEGVSVYSLDTISMFDPFQLDSQTNAEVIKRAVWNNDYSTAIMASLRLNNAQYITECLESTSISQIPLVASSLPLMYAERLLKWMVEGNVMSSTRHVHFYMIWLRAILQHHGMQLKGRADVATLTGIQQIVAHHQQHITKLANQNKFALNWLVKIRQSKKSVKKEEEEEEDVSDESDDEDIEDESAGSDDEDSDDSVEIIE